MVEPEDVEEQWSDAHDTLDDHPLRLHPSPRGIEEIRNPEHDSISIRAVKITTDGDKEDSGPTLGSTSPGSFSPTRERSSDAASSHSLPVVHVTEPQSTTLQTQEPSSAPRLPARSQMAGVDSSLAERERRHRRRSAVEVRSSSRLSGFLNNLIHRRDHPPNGSSRLGREESLPPSPNVPSNSNPPSRPSSPIPARTVTPPPHLPPPTLQELGLSFSVITSNLSPSHFSTPPTSGAFLGPHYLLLCHAQGLDVLPLVAPPAPQPYALVRRVAFKTVVVMEQRGVLVAIAGRRDGVRVYALEEVKKAVEWRIDVEIKRERERMRREAAKKITSSIDSFSSEHRDSSDKNPKPQISGPPPALTKMKSDRNLSYPGASAPAPQIPRAPTIKLSPRLPFQPTPNTSSYQERPPPYSPQLRSHASAISIRQRSRSGSVTNVLAGAPSIRRNDDSDSRRARDPDSKSDWVEARDSSDDEAINVVAAASSGSQALDERTSAIGTPNITNSIRLDAQSSIPHATSSAPPRRPRPANLDISLARTNPNLPASEPSPTPTLLTLRQALSHPPTTLEALSLGVPQSNLEPGTPNEADEEEEDGPRITLAQALMESRIPELPPVGSRRSQAPILITSSHPVVTGDEDVPGSPRSSEHSTGTRRSAGPERRRRRWSVLDGMFTTGVPHLPIVPPSPAHSNSPLSYNGMSSPGSPNSPVRTGSRVARSQSHRTQSTPPAATTRPAVSVDAPSVPPLPRNPMAAPPSSRSRFIPRIISNAFHPRRPDEQSLAPAKAPENDAKKVVMVSGTLQAPPPKLEYVKLPGTKGAVMIKAVETPKKSFLAILCGENGEKVELFAGTYRTALGLSRTFILPDSPRSLELQLQGDDLVEVFLMFSQNVFGLEPATVRVREVRIGRAERRAARRRAREIRTGEPSTHDPEAAALGDEETSVNVSIGVTVSANHPAGSSGDVPDSPSFQPRLHPSDNAPPPAEISTTPAAMSHAEEIVALATAQMGPYTTFQQLSFAPNFPLASIADEYIIPPTYPTFLDYRSEHEPEPNGVTDLSQIQFSPPGLPVPTPSAPSKWYYRDPKDVIHGPWKASLMQAWYKDGLLPPDLPIRREEDTEYTLLKELRLQSVDPAHPFRSAPPPVVHAPIPLAEDVKPLLPPLSLLSQPRHFGPPALFFSSRGGHSTTIVDARGRSVLKGRFVWSEEEQGDDAKLSTYGRMGDVKRLETFDVNDRSILVALRQGGLEAVDLGDALLKPADESRTVLPQFMPPPSNTNRRVPFVWKIGSPVSSSPTSSTILPPKLKGSSAVTSKKHSTTSAKSPATKAEFSSSANGGDEPDNHDEVLFLGRKDDEIYFCERNAGAFRILRLCPNHS